MLLTLIFVPSTAKWVNIKKEPSLEQQTEEHDENVLLERLSSKGVMDQPVSPVLVSSTALGVGQRAQHPADNIRYDGMHHMSTWLPKEGGKKRCKHCRTSSTQHICSKKIAMLSTTNATVN